MPEFAQRSDLIRLTLVAEPFLGRLNVSPPSSVIALRLVKGPVPVALAVDRLPIRVALAAEITHAGVLTRISEDHVKIVQCLTATEELSLTASRMVKASGHGTSGIVDVDATARGFLLECNDT